MVAVAARLPAFDVGPALLDYLRRRLEVHDLAYAEGPALIPDGWEAHVFHFQLQSRRGLPASFTRPLVVRAYCSHEGAARIQHEYDVQTYLADHGYPAPRPLLVEEGDEPFGGPFMVMEFVPGRPLLEVMLHNFLGIWWAPGEMARTHARLHRIPPDPATRPAVPFLERSLAAMETAVQEHRLYDLQPGLDWLETHQPGPPESECVLHLDFHPVNLLFAGGHCTAVLDWSESDVGDRHADLGTTMILVESAPVDLRKLRHRVATQVGKVMLKRWYLQTYRKELPVDEERLEYYTAWATLRRLCAWGRWLRVGPQVTGAKPSSVRHLRPDRIAFLCRRFEKRTGVAVRLV